jgi:predicted aspartyl protease
MGLIYAEIELINAGDLELVKRNFMDVDEIKKIRIDMLVDTGAYNLCINEEIQAQLQLSFVEKRSAYTADNRLIEMDVVGPVLLNLKIELHHALPWSFLAIASRSLERYL